MKKHVSISKILFFLFVTLFFSAAHGQYVVNFEGTGETKTSYTSGSVTLSGISWNMTVALIGTDAADYKYGLRSARLRGYATSSMTMLADKPNGLGTVSFSYWRYGTDAQVTWKVEYSTDGGVSWTQAGSDFSAPGNNTEQTFSAAVDVSGDVRIRIIHASGGTTSNRRMNIDNITLTDYVGITPSISVSPSSLSGFQYYFGQGPSAEQPITLTGSNLTNDIFINAPADYEISENIAGPYSSALQIVQTGGSISTLVYVRLKQGLAVGDYNNELITFTSTGAINKTDSCSGSVLAAIPTLIVSPATLSGFTYVIGNGPSAEKFFTVEGANLTNDIVIVPPTNYEISTGTGVAFSAQNPIPLSPTGGVVSGTTIYIRLIAGLPLGTYNGELINITSIDATASTVTCNGTVTDPLPAATVLARPQYIDISSTTSESAVLMQLENYTTDDVRYRLYNGGNQYYCWDEVNDAYVTSTSYANGPLVSGTPTTSSTFWIVFQRGSNNTAIASYRDRLGSTYSTNHLTAVLPTSSEITASFVLSGEFAGSGSYDNTVKHVVLGYAGTTLISAASTTLSTGAFSLVCPDGTTIDKIEFRAIDNTLIDQITGLWSTTAVVISSSNIIVSPSTLTGFSYFFGSGPSDELEFLVSGTNLTNDILITAPSDFEISETSGTNFIAVPTITLYQSSGSVASTPVYVRLKEGLAIDDYFNDIVLSSLSAVNRTVSCEGSVLAVVPTITLGTNALSAFVYETGNGPSAEQSFTVSGVNLTGDIVLTAPLNYEISTGTGVSFVAQSPLTLYHTGGVVTETTIYVRLAEGLIVGSYDNELITVESQGTAQQTVTCSGSVILPQPVASVLLRPAYVDITESSSQGAVLMKINNYPQDDARYRLYNGSYQYNCWNSDSIEYISMFSYSAGPPVHGTPSTETVFWIMYERGDNISTSASYRDRLGPDYLTNYQTTALPSATEITSGFELSGVFTGIGIYDTTAKHVVLAYSGTSLIAAASTTKSTGTFSVVCPESITIDKIEIRAVDNTLIDYITGTWTVTEDVGVIPFIPTTKTLQMNIFIEGLYTGAGTMREAEGDSGPQFGAGIADEIIVELYDPLDLSMPVYQNINVILSTDGNALISDIPSILDNEYYIVIKHRNSIETWSSLPFLLTGTGPFNYDFSSAASQAYGNNMLAVAGGFFAIWSGDANVDGIVDIDDMTLIDNASQTPALQGYNPQDLNGDGIVDIDDMTIIDNNSQSPAKQVMKP